MNTNGHGHLTHDELLKAVVEAADIPSDRQEHLKTCPACREDYARMRNRFEHIGRTAARLAPKPARPFRLPAKQAQAARRRFKPLWIMGLSAAMLLTIVVWRPQWLDHPRSPQMTTAGVVEYREFMNSIDELVEDALPLPYQQLASLNDAIASNEPDAGEDYLNWLVPSIEEEEDESFS